MERRKFLKYLGIGTVGVVIGTKVALNVTEVSKSVTEVPKDVIIGDGWKSYREDYINSVMKFKNGSKIRL